MYSPTRNASYILVLNSNPNSHFCPGCAKQAQNWFWNSLKIKSPQQANPEKLFRNSVVILCADKLKVVGDEYKIIGMPQWITVQGQICGHILLVRFVRMHSSGLSSYFPSRFTQVTIRLSAANHASMALMSRRLYKVWCEVWIQMVL